MNYGNRLVLGATFPNGSYVANEEPDELLILDVGTSQKVEAYFNASGSWNDIFGILGILVNANLDMVGSRNFVWSSKGMLDLAEECQENPQSVVAHNFTKACGLRSAIIRLTTMSKSAPTPPVDDRKAQIADLDTIHNLWLCDYTKRSPGELMYDMGVRFTGE